MNELVDVAFVAVRLVRSAMFEVRYVMNELVEVLLVAVRLVKNPVVAVRRVAKKLEEVALVRVALDAVRSATLVVASVEVPRTVSCPDVVAFPATSTVKFVFSVHPLPFQYRVVFCCVPSESVPLTDVQ
jgi:hypothetical protein